MKSFKLYCVAVALVFGVMSQAKAAKYQHQLSCGGDYRVSGQTFGRPHSDIERAGVILCKDYGRDQREPQDRCAVILGRDKNTKSWMFQAGKVEGPHAYTSQTASNELYEETGGLLHYDSHHISQLPYIYSGQKQLFFLKDDNNSNIGVGKIKDSCLKAINNPRLKPSMQEIDDVAAVSVNELLRVAKNIYQGPNPLGHRKLYTLKTRTAQKEIQIDGYYMRMIANQLNASQRIFAQVFGTQVFGS